MKRFFRNVMVFLLGFLLIAAVCVLCVVYVVPSYPANSNDYMSIVNVKFEQLKTVKSPRIILLGGSSLAFGLNQYLLSERTGLPVVNTGCHAGLGLPFMVEQVKRNLQRGDIVIAAPEYSISMGNPMPELLTMGGIERKYLSGFTIYGDLTHYSPAYAIRKLHRFFRYGIRGKPQPLAWSIKAEPSAYMRSAFDDNGQMTFPRPEPVPPETRAEWPKDNIVYPDELVAYLNSFNEYAREKGAALLLSFPPVAETCVPSSPEEVDKAQKQAEDAFHFPVISRIREYLFPIELMYDTLYHCNSRGEMRRTEQLADDVNRYLKGMRIALPR